MNLLKDKKGKTLNIMKFKKILFSILIISILFSSICASAAPEERNWDSWAPNGELRTNAVGTAGAAILMDAYTGEILFENYDETDVDRNTKMFPASTTKIMTALVVIENTSLVETVVINESIRDQIRLFEDGTKVIKIKLGQEFRVIDLLYGLMLESGADAAIALAQHVSGTHAEFVGLMNERAKEIGMENTYFMNAHGLHDENHYSTVYDMAKLCQVVMKNQDFRNIVSAPLYAPIVFEDTIWRNSNKLVDPQDEYIYEHAIGIKTGYTSVAGYNLASAAKKDDVELIAVIFNDISDSRFTNSVTLFEYGFMFYDTINLSTILSKDKLTSNVLNASTANEDIPDLNMSVLADKDVFFTDKKEIIQSIKTNASFFEKIPQYSIILQAPIAKGTIVGTVDYVYNDEILFTGTLIAANEVKVMDLATPMPTVEPSIEKKSSFEKLMDYIVYFVVALVLLLIVIVFLLIASSRRAKSSAKYSHSSTHKDGTTNRPKTSRKSNESRSGSTKRRRY